MTIHLEITTPEKEIFSDDIDEVTVPTLAGEISILPNHVALLTKINPGELTIKKDGKNLHFAITGGFLEVTNNNINILADYAIRAEDIEVTKAQEAEARAKVAMKEKTDRRDFIIAEAELRKSLLELKVARKYRKSTPQ